VRRLAVAARPHARVILASGLTFPLVAAVELLQPYLLKVAIDDHILKGDWPGLTRVVAALLAALLALYGLRAAEDYLMTLSGQRVIHDLRASLFAHLLRLEAAFFDRTPVGRLMTACSTTSRPSATPSPRDSSRWSATWSCSPAWWA